MAKKLTYFDDLNGEPIKDGHGGTVRFSYKDRNYEIDLTEQNDAKLAEALAPFIAAARTLIEKKVKTAPTVETRPYELIDARRWLIANGFNVSQRGPLAGELLEHYERAQNMGEKR